MQVDLTTQLGSVSPTITTGLRALDELLGGGLRPGMLIAVSGAPGVGKTALALMLAYMAARTKAGVLFTSAVLDDTEVLARLTARALHREYQNVDATYGSIWTGEAMQNAALQGPINACIDGVANKVGAHLHLHSARPMESTAMLSAKAALLSARHDRVVAVVDGIEGFAASGDGSTRKAELANSSYEGRICQASYELAKLAAGGCSVIVTSQAGTAPLVVPAATVAGELRIVNDPVGRRRVREPIALATRPVDLVVSKNRLGRTGTLPLSYFAAGSVFEERPP